jgi:glycine/D-amino acid oxidase-like deaminating enzyme
VPVRECVCLFVFVNDVHICVSNQRPLAPFYISKMVVGIQGTSVAYYLAEQQSKQMENTMTLITVLESSENPASAASGKGGGFMARSWGDGTPTEGLHHVAFDLYGPLAKQLGCTSYRTLPVWSVAPDYGAVSTAKKVKSAKNWPNWLDGSVGRVSVMGHGEDTAQITPDELVNKMLAYHQDRITVVRGTCVGVTSEDCVNDDTTPTRQVTGVQYILPNGAEGVLLPADVVVVAAGPWSCAAEDWFKGDGSSSAMMQWPMEGIKSTSIVWKQPESLDKVDATALFCGEDSRHGTHLEVYPRPNGEIYICGIGGSDHISKTELKGGAFRDACEAKADRVEAAKSAFTKMSLTFQNKGELARVQACMRPCPPDALPYMGAIPGYRGAYMNAGHNCWGIAWAPACGLAMAELILQGKCTCVDLSPFDPARFTPAAVRGNRGRKQQGTNVGEQW